MQLLILYFLLDMVMRILYPMFAVGLVDHPVSGKILQLFSHFPLVYLGSPFPLSLLTTSRSSSSLSC